MTARFWARCGHPVAPYEAEQPYRCAHCPDTARITRPVIQRPTPPLPERPILGSDDILMLPSEVADAFRVDVKSVSRWARQGKLTCIRTLGGHRRFYESEVYALLYGGDPS